ncbi:hypothetical protein [Lacticaseibacillus mingshuiensis]|uniref:DUF1737 domain-containing protein n=1 Tax=Lacticaseibacillus mingshuiensis TaxID=2799574 RepID=A0ABW4CI28_9LACO|nr:hypothetical protein [Lacticaseibacillus mingshuiensis]
MDNIYRIKEITSASAAADANAYLEKGWRLVTAGTKTIIDDLGDSYQTIAYVVGATKQQWDEYNAVRASAKIDSPLKPDLFRDGNE